MLGAGKKILLKPSDLNFAANTVGNHPSAGQLPVDAASQDLKNLLDAIFEQYGVDFRDYAYSSLRRRILRQVTEEKTGTIPGLQKLVLTDRSAMERLLTALTIHVT